MKYTPEKYEWDNGDIVASNEYLQCAIRTSPDRWVNTLIGEHIRVYSDATITKWIKAKDWDYLGNPKNGITI